MKSSFSFSQLSRNCSSSNPTIIQVEEIEDCEYKIVLGDRSCRPKNNTMIIKRRKKRSKTEEGEEPKLKRRACEIESIGRVDESHPKCHRGKRATMGCTTDGGMWVLGQCSGKFRCNGKVVICYPYSHSCACG